MKKIKEKWRVFYSKKLLKIYYQFFKIELYNSIYDLPAWIWFDIHKDNDFELLIVNKEKQDRAFAYVNKLVNAWESIYNEYLVQFPPKEYYANLKLRFEIAKLRNDSIVFGDRYKETIADIKEASLEDKEKMNKKKPNKFNENCVLMQKHLGIKINPRKISIFEYQNNLITLSKENGS